MTLHAHKNNSVNFLSPEPVPIVSQEWGTITCDMLKTSMDLVTVPSIAEECGQVEGRYRVARAGECAVCPSTTGWSKLRPFC